MIRQNVLLSNANKSNVYNLNNDITLNFPTNLFFKPPQFIELLNLDLNAEINLFGNTNNSLYIEYKGQKHLIYIEYTVALKTDYQLAQAVKLALNNPKDPTDPTLSLPYIGNDLTFDLQESAIENVVTNFKIERESFTTAYTITCTNPCIIDFNHKDSIGPILGFGNGTYAGVTEIAGTSTQSISAYNYIDIINASGSTDAGEPAGLFPNYNDVNCKMVLYNSDQLIIPNKYKSQDTTISLNPGLGTKQYENIGEILSLIEDQLNDYKNEFNPVANFLVSYDNATAKITIKNTTGAKFGLGFDFSNITKDRIMTSSNGTSWAATPSITNNDWSSVAYGIVSGNDILVAVSTSGTGDRIMRASNSTTFWTTVTSPADNNWTSITWSSDLLLFCAVASSGNTNRVMTSPDGITWTLRTSASNNDWRSVTWGGANGQKKFVAVSSTGTGNRVMTSADGITWTSQVSSADNYWNSVIWSPGLGLFCAIASSGIGNRVMTSPDGITWTSRTSSDDYDWKSITWSPALGIFCAVASSGVTHRVMTSTNGINWTRRHAAADNNWKSVTWSPSLGLFCAVATSGTTNRIMYSNNGTTWTSIVNSPINIDWNSVIWADGDINSFVSVGSSFGNTSGSLHYILGLEQKSYYDLSDIISITDILCYENIFADDYILICSDIVNNATDLNVIGIGNADNIKSNNIIFAVPLSQSKHFRPIDSSYYRINISASKFSLGYKNKKFTSTNPNFVNFYLRLLSGRHITCTSQYTMQLSFLF
ncbi:MAG: hypothetical protein EBV19_06180 [Flavobacteriia bacterium]|nr:hypothetical protein [Flavobacteriia bacterium]